MTQRHIRFPSIEQYRTVVHNVVHRSTYTGSDENGNPLYNTTLPAPTLSFRGTVKLHGTNAGIARDVEGNMWTQSRENIITPQDDNAGFSMFVHSNRDFFNVMLEQATLCKSITGDEAILVFGEWCGGNIQKKMAITQFPKMFVVFGICRADADNQKDWLNPNEIAIVWERTMAHCSSLVPTNVYHIDQFPTYSIDIDFNRPHDAQNKLVEITLAVEDECPVGKQLGATIENGPIIGEGVVWVCTTAGYGDSGFWFKVKGEKHSAASKSRTKTLNAVDIERIDAIVALAEEVTPEWRLEQMYEQTFNTINGGLPDIKRMGEYIKAVMGDVLKEELDIIAASGFTTKDITSPIAKIARDYLLSQLQP